MSGECDICGDWGHVEESCPNVEAALKLAQQDRARLKKEYESISKELSDAERHIYYYQEILHRRRHPEKYKPD